MSRYIITINTDAYKPLKATEKDWERGTINDFMEALKGYKVTETSLRGVRKRVNVFLGRWGSESDGSLEEHFAWLDDPKTKVRIKFYDSMCGFERVEYVAPYGLKQGYIDIDNIMEALKTKGKVIIPFEETYDKRQVGAKLFKGCYMKIEKK